MIPARGQTDRHAQPEQADVDVVETGEHFPLQKQELVRIHHDLHEGGQTHEQRSDDQSGQQEEIHAPPLFPEKRQKEDAVCPDHESDGQEEIACPGHHFQFPGTEEKDDDGLDEKIQGIQPHDGRCQDTVAGDGLEGDGRIADTPGGYENGHDFFQSSRQKEADIVGV